MSRSGYIRNRFFRTFFVASLLASLVFQVNVLVDAIIVSHVVSPDAISAIGLLSPVLNFLMFAGEIILGGTTILVSKMIGAQEYRDASRLGVACLTSMLVFYFLISIVFFVWTDDILSFFIDDPRFLPLMSDYLPVIVFSLILVEPKLLMSMLIKTAGKPILVTRSALAQCIANLLLDLLFVIVFDWGISGAAWASLCSVFVSISFFLPYFKSKDNIYVWQMPKFSWYYPMTMSTISIGLPLGVTSLVFTLFMASLNTIYYSAAGADGVFIMTVTVQMLTICMLVLEASTSSIYTIGGILIGEKDIEGYRNFVYDRLKRTAFVVAVISIIMAFFSGFIAEIFGASSDMLPNVRTPIGLMCLIFVPYSIYTLLFTSLVVTGHKNLAAFEFLLLLLCNVPIVFVVSKYFLKYLWFALPVGMWIMLLLTIFCNWLVSRLNKDLHWLTLIPKYPNDLSVERSIAFDKVELGKFLKDLYLFIDICELSQRTANNILHCIEELSCNIIEMAEKTYHKGFFDIRVVESFNEIFVVIRDDNRPYDPVYPYKAEFGMMVEDDKIGLVMVNALCENISYRYMNGVNCTYMKFNKFKFS